MNSQIINQLYLPVMIYRLTIRLYNQQMVSQVKNCPQCCNGGYKVRETFFYNTCIVYLCTCSFYVIEPNCQSKADLP